MEPRPKAVTPYVGPRPFERAEREFFFGRDKESQRIVMRIISNRAFLLYAQSGAGKTSILNTQVIPMLEEKGFEVYPTARVSGASPVGSAIEEVANIFIYNTLMSWTKKGDGVERLADMSLAAFLAEHDHPKNADGISMPRVIVFDQFEELFTYYPQFWQQHAPFFEQLRTAMEKDSALWIIFSAREDFIARLDNYAQYFEDRLRGRYRLEPLTRESALQAVVGPLKKLEIDFAPGIAETIVDDLLQIRVTSVAGEPTTARGEFVEPVQLQVACQSLWQNLGDAKLVTREYLEKFGGVDQALITFYEQSIRSALLGTRVRERTLRAWFDRYMITPMGTRGNIFRGPDKTGDLPNGVVDALQDAHLLRSEERAGASWYELAHDRFVGPIQASNRAWRARTAQRQFRLFGALFLVAALILIPALFVIIQQATLTAASDVSATAVTVYGTRAAEIVAGVVDNRALVVSNGDWKAISGMFNTIEMVLVPPGCMNMGSFIGDPDEQPVHVYCFKQNFWIDRYEVSNAAFESLGGQAKQPAPWPDANAPRTSVTWFEADAFCRARNSNARLATEAEWEYAARGPDSLTYPWGNTFDPAKVVYQGNSDKPADVGTLPQGTAWVGALNMSGNAWEWTHTIYDPVVFPYPYDPNDGREAPESNNLRVIRGGSFNTSEAGVRSANRYGGDPLSAFPDVGFRCVISQEAH